MMGTRTCKLSGSNRGAFAAGSGWHAIHSRRTVRRSQPLTVRSVAVEEPETLSIDSQTSDIDKEAAYKQFEALLDQFAVSFTPGEKVSGTVFNIDNRGAYIDVGGKSAAYCPTTELSLAPISRPTDVVDLNDVREFEILREENNGLLVLSLKKIEMVAAWGRLRTLMEEDTKVAGPVVGVNRGGLIVEIEGIRGFCPGSQLAKRVVSFDELMGHTIDFKITEVDEEKQRLMLSARAAAAPEQAINYNVGDVIEGTVSAVKPYGAFIDLGNGASGLLHISQISHDRILNVDKVLADGDRIKVMVLSQDKERGRLALCTKKLEPTPGDMLRDPALVYEKAEAMAAKFKERVAAAEAAARADSSGESA